MSAADSPGGIYEETMAVFVGRERPHEPLTTTEVADELDCARRTAYKRLRRLAERDVVETKKVGARGRVWWLSPDRPGESGPRTGRDESGAATDRESTGARATNGWTPATDGRPGPHARRFDSPTVETPPAAETTGEAMFTLDSAGRVTSWSAGAEALTGHGTAEVLGEHVSTLYTAADREAGVPERTLREAADEGRIEEEGWRVSADGSRFRVVATRTAIVDAAGEVEGFVETLRDVTASRGRERRPRTELQEVLDRFSDAFYAVDDEWRITHFNEAAGALLQHDPSAALGEDLWETFPAAVDSEVAEALRGALETQEPRRVEVYHDRLDAWHEVTVYPSGSGLSVYLRDVTGRVERERAIEESERRYRTLAEQFPNGGVALFDNDLRYTLVAGQIFEKYDIDPSEFEGAEVDELHTPDGAGARLESAYRAALDGETRRFEFEWRGRTLDTWTLPVTDDDGEVLGGMVMTQDVTGRAERKRALERYRTIVETVDDGVYVLDDECRFALVNDAYAEMTGYDRETLLGSHCSLVVGDEVPREAAERSMQRDADGGNATIETEVRRADGDLLPTESNVTPITAGDEYLGTVGIVRDVTDRRRYEETLHALHRSSRRLLGAETHRAVSEIVVDAATDVLDLPGVVVYHHEPEADRLVPDARSVETGFMRQSFPTLPADRSSITGRAFVDGEATVLDDVLASPDLQVEPAETEMRSGLFFPMAEHGVLVAGSRSVGAFEGTDRQLVEILATNAEAAYDRVDRESRLRNQRDRLTALDDFNTVVREITVALVRQSTREEIEAIVAERLAASDSYELAWLSGVDPTSGRIEAHVEAGVDGFLDDAKPSMDPDAPTGSGLAAAAVRSQEMRVSRNVLESPSSERWGEFARRYGYQSLAVIPIEHEGSLFGLLGVHSRRPEAFAEEERAVIGQLGELVGLAIASVERKRALMSDEMVELEFYAPGVADSYGVELPGSITFHRSVPVADGEFLEYGTTSNETFERFEALAERVPHWERLTVISEEAAEVDFELLLTEPPLVSLVASYGGYIESSGIDDGDYHISVHLPPSVPVREVVEQVKGSYPSAQVVSKRQLARTERGPDHLESILSEELTDRQRTALEAAFFAGFFDWPRDSRGEDVAESLGVSGPTFSYHIRHAERKLLERLFETPSAPNG